jgi:hypothetical protein
VNCSDSWFSDIRFITATMKQSSVCDQIFLLSGKETEISQERIVNFTSLREDGGANHRYIDKNSYYGRFYCKLADCCMVLNAGATTCKTYVM